MTDNTKDVMTDSTTDSFVDLINASKVKNDEGVRSSRLINNADIEHAKVAVEAVLDVAIEDKKDVCIVTDSLRKDFYSNEKLVSKARELLTNKNKIEIIVLDPNADLTQNTFADVVRDDSYGSILLGDKKHSAPHFIVAGDRVFRLETNHNQTKATISFNNESIGSCLLAEFNRLKAILEPSKGL